jgi:iron complex transport system permease protein
VADEALKPKPRGAAQHPLGMSLGVLAALAYVFCCVAFLRLGIGTSGISWPFEGGIDIWETRGMRLAVGAIAGAGLAVSGVALQAVLRNPLAEPFVLGLSSGAALGVMLQLLIGSVLGMAMGANQAGAMLGAAASMLIVYLTSRRHGTIDPLGLLLTGVVLATINGAIIMVLQYFVGPGWLKENLSRWMMGYIDEGLASGTVFTVGIVAAVVTVVLWFFGRAMDIATTSETEAVSLGVNIGVMRKVLFIGASLLAGGSVVLVGPVSFVGLICPHLARLMLGPGHRGLIVGSAMLGATLVVAADTAAATLDLNQRIGIMPIGVFTAMLGGPVFLWMLRPHLGRGEE